MVEMQFKNERRARFSRVVQMNATLTAVHHNTLPCQ